jgi:uncharacterized protein
METPIVTQYPSADVPLKKAKRATSWDDSVMPTPPVTPVRDRDELHLLRERIGSIHFDQRLGIERDKQAKVFGQGRTFFHIENWSLVGWLVKYGLKATGLINRGKRNARKILLRENTVAIPQLPALFENYTLLHLSDLHLDIAEDIPHALIQAVRQADYDICVLTGDFRAKTHGEFGRAVDGLRQLRAHLKPEVYAVLGNHDSLLMAPEIEALGIQVLLNEHLAIERTSEKNSARIHLAGIDDPHYYKTDNFDKAARAIPQDEVSILLSHSPEVYQHAAYANFDLMLCGHTHGGQICLPGGYPVILNANCPRQMCIGAWRYQQMQGYTSVGAGTCVVDVRFNCPPEVTLHRLQRA